MVLVDTSVWVDVLRDQSGTRRAQLAAVVDPADVILTRFTVLELLQGCDDERGWALLEPVLDAQEYVESVASTSANAARIYLGADRPRSRDCGFRTLRSPIDCCIAQLAMDAGVTLVHRDRDFETIATVRPLGQTFLEWHQR